MDHLWVFCPVFVVPLCASFYLCLWTTVGKGLTSWLSFVLSICKFVAFPLVSWVRCGTWLHRFLIFVPLLTLFPKNKGRLWKRQLYTLFCPKLSLLHFISCYIIWVIQIDKTFNPIDIYKIISFAYLCILMKQKIEVKSWKNYFHPSPPPPPPHTHIPREGWELIILTLHPY